MSARLFATPFSSIYPLYVAKVERKGRTKAELDAVIAWLLGVDAEALGHHLAAGTSVADFFGGAVMHARAASVTGVICGVRIEEMTDPLMQRVRRLDKLVDELARGRPMEKVLRSA